MKRILIFLFAMTISSVLNAKEYHVAKTGNDKNIGTLSAPLFTIQAAAEKAQPGDVITVHVGIYREEIISPRGGDSVKKPIVYRAAAGENVSICGSERIDNWSKQEGNVWMVKLDNIYFGKYNPYDINLLGSWLSYGKEYHIGEVYLNRIAFYEKLSLKDVKRFSNTWYTDVDDKTTTIWANFGWADPNNNLAGIVGSWGCVGSTIENNYISETNCKNEFGGAETATIKLHFPIDVIIRYNYCKGVVGLRHRTKGIGLDWGVQNTRITGNIVTDFQAEGFKLEVGHGPRIVDNNLFINSEIVQWVDAGLFMHNLFYYCSFTFQNNDRIVPYYESYPIKQKSRGTTLNNYDQYHNNIFIGNGLDGVSEKSIGCRINHNVYLEGAQKNINLDSKSIVDEVQTGFDIQKVSHPQMISLNPGEELFKKVYTLITSEYIGKLPVPKMAMKKPDGTPLDINTDYFGNPIVTANVMPGPFQNMKSEANVFEVWPRKKRNN